MLQDKSSTWKAWKDECVCICLRFLEHCWANVCPRFTYWDGTTEDAKKEAAKYILYVKYWINSLLKESLAAEHYVPYHPSLPSFFFFFENFCDHRSFCFISKWVIVCLRSWAAGLISCEAATSSLGACPCDQAALCILMHPYNQYSRFYTGESKAGL